MIKTNYKILLRCLVLCLLLGQAVVLWAQENDATITYQTEQQGEATFDASIWKENAKLMKFSTKPQVKKISPKNTAPLQLPQRASKTTTSTAQTLLLILVLLLLVFLIYKGIVGNTTLSNLAIQHKQPIALEDIETNLEDADIEGFLKQSLQQKDYRLAIRLYYLAIIKELSAKEWIEWKKDKTNGQYLRELRKKQYPQINAFQGVTRIFEYVWYSNTKFEGTQFEEVRIDFNNLLQSIK